ncbi:MAG: YcxB family protein [Clostridium sp.]
MKIKYSITKDDYLKFNMYHLESSPGVKKELIIHRFVVPILIIGLAFALAVLTGMPLTIGVPVCVVGAICWSVFYPKFYKKNALRNVSKMLGRGVQSESISKNSITVQDEGIYASSQAGQTLHKWNEVIKFHETADHIFIYVTQKLAHVIPKRAFKDKEEENEFIEIIKKNIK